MTEYPRPIEGGNAGDGSPLVLGDDRQIGDMHSPCDPTSTVHVLDWDGDGEPELVCSGNEIFSYKFIDALADGTPVVDRGLRWGTMSRSAQRDENDEGLTGFVLAAGNFLGNGSVEAVLGPRYYSRKPVVAFPLAEGAPTSRERGQPVTILHMSGCIAAPTKLDRGSAAALDWNGDGRDGLVVIDRGDRENYHLDPNTGVCPEDQRDRYGHDGRWIGKLPSPTLQLYSRSGLTGRGVEFIYAGTPDVRLPKHTMWVSVVDPTDVSAGLLLLTYYGKVYHLPVPVVESGPPTEWKVPPQGYPSGEPPLPPPQWGTPTELFTLHNEPFNRVTNFDISIGVSDALEPGRFDIFAGDRSQSPSWCRFHGRDDGGRPIYDTPKKVKQRNPHVGNSFFSVPTVGDWRDTGTPDILVGGVEGYILWYKILSTDPLRFAPPERVRCGTTEIRRLAAPNPAGGHHWGGSQGPYDGDIGGYSNPVLADWNANGLLDLIVSDMIGLYDWYPNWGTKQEPDLGPPQRLHLTTGDPVRGPWRQQPGIGCFSESGLPDLVIQDMDLDLAIFRRAGASEPSLLFPGEKLRYEDGETIKTHGVYTPSGGDGRGRTKITVVDWDGDGVLDLLLGVGPQHQSPYRGSYVLFAKNVGSNAKPIFRRPEVILWNTDGKPLEFWRHGVHPAPVDWDDDGRLGLIAGADQGRVWYWKPQAFGASASGDPTAPLRPQDEHGLGRDD